MMHMPAFQPDQGPRQAHRALKASIGIIDRAQHCAVLWFSDILERKLYRDLGFSSMRAYATEALGFSPTRAGDYIRLARKLESLPVVKEEVAAGRLGYTKAREIASVADRSSEKKWVEVAKVKSRRDLEATVRQARKRAARERVDNPAQVELVPRPEPTAPPAASPVRVSFELTPAQYARYEAMLAKIGPRGDKADLLLDMAEALLVAGENAPRGASPEHRDGGPHIQIHVHECPTCSRATVQTPAGEMELAGPEMEAAGCDARIQKPGERNRATIPPRIRREVLARDRHRCRRKGCGHTRFLHVHHIIPRAAGGGNHPDNLITLCAACHALWHEKGDALPGMKPVRGQKNTPRVCPGGRSQTEP